jgi:hypothetical protein
MGAGMLEKHQNFPCKLFELRFRMKKIQMQTAYMIEDPARDWSEKFQLHDIHPIYVSSHDVFPHVCFIQEMRLDSREVSVDRLQPQSGEVRGPKVENTC